MEPANPQTPTAIFMVRPSSFFPNEQTAEDNVFQTSAPLQDAQAIAHSAQKEFDGVAKQLQKYGVNLHVFEDTINPKKPDAVFPNNWISTHPDGSVVLYPMYAPVRRLERRQDVIDFLQAHYQVGRVIDLTSQETNEKYLEGTGALVLDHENKLAFCALSHRADADLVHNACAQLKLEPVLFTSLDSHNIPIYHTNVMMSIGQKFAMICLESIKDDNEKQNILNKLEQTGKKIITLSLEQIQRFSGNVLELKGHQGPILALSTTAQAALTPAQIQVLEGYVELCPMAIPHIEFGGGSIRCMIAGIHLQTKNHQSNKVLNSE